MPGRTGSEYHPSPEMLQLLERAVELRAAGTPWDEVARQLGRHPNTCKEWPVSYRAVWDRLYMVAIRRRFNGVFAEATLHLCRLMRADDLKINLGACREVMRHMPTALPQADGVPPGFNEIDGVFHAMAKLSDEQLDYLAELDEPTPDEAPVDAGPAFAPSLDGEDR